MIHYLKIIFTTIVCLFYFTGRSQSLKLDQIIAFPLQSYEQVGTYLEKGGWQINNVEMVNDSNFIRRSWKHGNRNTGPEAYFIYYDFTKDSLDNYIVYQFTDRTALNDYRKELKDKGYKLLKAKKSKKKNNESHVNNEKEEIYYIEKKSAMVVLKELFVYGLNSFLVYSYKPKSFLIKSILESKIK